MFCLLCLLGFPIVKNTIHRFFFVLPKKSESRVIIFHSFFPSQIFSSQKHVECTNSKAMAHFFGGKKILWRCPQFVFYFQFCYDLSQLRSSHCIHANKESLLLSTKCGFLLETTYPRATFLSDTLIVPWRTTQDCDLLT